MEKKEREIRKISGSKGEKGSILGQLWEIPQDSIHPVRVGGHLLTGRREREREREDLSKKITKGKKVPQ